MKYRKLDSNGDYTFGKQDGNFYDNVPQAVAQAVQTRLALLEGEWFLDTSAGVPYESLVFGKGTLLTFDDVIKTTILDTQGVTGITSYASGVDSKRRAVVSCSIDTLYGGIPLPTMLAQRTAGQLLDINFILDSSILGWTTNYLQAQDGSYILDSNGARILIT